MSSAEFRITNDLTLLKSFTIQGNFDECRAWLTEELEPYRTMAVTQDSMPQAKKYRANIRRVREHIDECRKLAKKEALAVYEPFETRCKELTALCDEAAKAIDAQVKAYEEAAKAEKEKALREYFDAQIDDMAGYLSWESAFNSRWLNATFGLEKAQGDIDAAITRCLDEVGSIRALNSEFEPALLLEYRQTHDLGACLRRNAELAETKRREEQRKAEQEAARRAAQEAERAAAADAAPIPEREPEPPAAEEARPSSEAHAQEDLITLDFRAYLTREQLWKLKQFLNENGIRYTRVP